MASERLAGKLAGSTKSASRPPSGRALTDRGVACVYQAMGHAMAVAVETGLGGFVTTALTARRRTGGMHSKECAARSWLTIGKVARQRCGDPGRRPHRQGTAERHRLSFRSASVRSERGDAPLTDIRFATSLSSRRDERDAGDGARRWEIDHLDSIRDSNPAMV